MVNDVRRFLGLNALLHGHSASEVFMGAAEELLALDKERTDTLLQELDAIPKNECTSDQLTHALLNFYRNNNYAFLSLNGQYIVKLEDFAHDDFMGKVDKGMSDPFIANLLRDYAMTTMEGQPYIADGVLHCTKKEFDGVVKSTKDAYKLFTKGPAGMTKKLNMLLRRHTSLEEYVPFSALELVEILDGLIAAKVHPVLCQETFLKTPDLMATYKATGCVMAFSDATHTSVDWLMDVEGCEDLATSVCVSIEDIRPHMLNDVRDLSGARAIAKRGRAVYDVCYAGD